MTLSLLDLEQEEFMGLGARKQRLSEAENKEEGEASPRLQGARKERLPKAAGGEEGEAS
jgi:hypothetical protein